MADCELLPVPLSRSSPSSLSSSSVADPAKEYRMVLLGTHHKKPLFEKMCSAAQKFEQHIQYADIWYLTFRFNGNEDPVVVELIDPGTEKTGERQMAIQQKSDAIILCYSAYNPNSFLALESVAEDFQAFNGQSPATLLLCNEDQLTEEGFEGGHESGTADDGYGTNSGGGSPLDKEQTVPNRRSMTPKGRTHSMERIREAREGGRCPIEREKGEQLCHSLGANCEFRTLSFTGQLADQFVLDLLGKLLRRAVEIKQQRRQNNCLNRPARPVTASAPRHLSPSPLVHILRRKTLNIKRKMMPQVKNKSRERAKTTIAAGEEKEKQTQKEGQTMAEEQQQPKASTSSQEMTVPITSKRVTNSEKANDDNGTTRCGQPITTTKKQKNYVQEMGAMLKTLTHPRERVRVGASKGKERTVKAAECQNPQNTTADAEVDSSASSSTRVNNFMEGKDTETATNGQQREEQQQKRSAHTQSSTCTIQ